MPDPSHEFSRSEYILESISLWMISVSRGGEVCMGEGGGGGSNYGRETFTVSRVATANNASLLASMQFSEESETRES